MKARPDIANSKFKLGEHNIGRNAFWECQEGYQEEVCSLYS